MSTDFGFDATSAQGYFFVSYNTEDSPRIAMICQHLHAAGLPIWYDEGIEHDSLWEGVLAERIDGCEEAIFFITKSIFEKGRIRGLEGVWTYKEYDLARIYEKKVLIVLLDEIVPREDVPHSMMAWWQQIGPGTRQGVVAYDEPPEETAAKILKELGRDSGRVHTMADSIDHPVFNSVVDHPLHGDERQFAQICKIGGTEWGRSIVLEPGAQYAVDVFYRNDADSRFNSSEHNHQAVAVKARMSVDLPQHVTERPTELTARIIWGDPKQERSDTIELTAPAGKGLNLHYVLGQSVIHNDWDTDGWAMPSSLFSHKGTLLGLNKLNGIVPAGDEYSGYVRFYFDVEE